eukprot:TRINITY_DN11987_c0_g1_i1.p1 TRINITY_DN11987_c0_g1~~TRINITY_DN11987_c0_g1_i1.p1  ORF type:complete len:134 (+),score=45.98 TRINITY_DN11987_c0_g1_i1:58-459(+)
MLRSGRIVQCAAGVGCVCPLAVADTFFFFFFFFFKQKTAYEMQRGLVGSEMCIRDRTELDGCCGRCHLVPVSYTHLTLPTILLVQISVVAGSLKKKKKNFKKNQVNHTSRENQYAIVKARAQATKSRTSRHST